MSSSLLGAAEVLVEGKPQLLVPPAVAVSADGASVPVSYSISGDVLTTHVDLSEGVEFPVLVDPEIKTFTLPVYYGDINGSETWAGWHAALTSNFELYDEAHLLEAFAPHGSSFDSYGQLYVYAPGPQGKPGSAGITRVDLTGVTHGLAEQSELQGEIAGSNGPLPVYSFNGSIAEDTKPSPLRTKANLGSDGLAFCAQEGGGVNDELCSEREYQGTYFTMADVAAVEPVTTNYSYVGFTSAKVTYREPRPPERVELKHAGYEGQWLQTAPDSFTIEAESEGMGVREVALEIKAGDKEGPFFEEANSCVTENGFTGCPSVMSSTAINLSGGMKETGAFELAPIAVGAAGSTSRKSASRVNLYLDKEPPVLGTLSGSLAEAANGVIGGGNYTLGLSATDGSKASPQSGVHFIEVKVDGKPADTIASACPSPKGVPAEGCFGLSGEWTMNAQSYGAGTHVVTVTAKDWAGNESAPQSFEVTVNEAAYEPLGPGAVNVETGDFRMNPTDVSIPGSGTTLSVSRTYDSRGVQGLTGMLGPEWSLNVPGAATAEEWQSLTPLSEGAVTLVRARGGEVTFAAKAGGGFISPAGYETETLSKPSASEYRISDSSGDYTAFTQPASGAAFVPSTTVQASAAGGLNPIKYTFTKTSEGVTEPTEVLVGEPSPAAGCSPTLTKGCRALTFEYATSSSATGEGPSQWGESKGHLAKVYFTAWDPSKGEMTKTAVAQYAYDLRGRLRAEWDPRIAPALKTIYGYKNGNPTVPGEDLITSVTPPGQETWAMTYGAIAGDTNVGRLLKVARAPASAPLWTSEPPKNTAKPALSGSPAVGITMGVSSGAWSNEPVAFSYQWEDCNSEGGFCKPIAGATNPNYTVASGDVGHTLVASVAATNGWGTVPIATAASGVVGGTGSEGTHYAPAPGATIDYHVPVYGVGAPHAMGAAEVKAWAQKDDPADATAIFPPDEPQSWPASNYERATVFYTDSAYRTVNIATPSGGIATAEYNKANDNLEITLSPDDREAALKEGNSGAAAEALQTVRQYSLDGSELLKVLGPQHAIKLATGEPLQARKNTEFYYDEGAPTEGGPYRLVTKTTESAQWGTTKLEEAETRTVKTFYNGQENLGWKLHEPTSSTTTANGITLKSTTVYEPKTGAVEETQTPAAAGKDASVPPAYTGQFGTKGTEAGQLEQPTYDALDAHGDVWVSEYGSNRISEFSSSGAFIETVGFGVSNGKAEREVCTSKCQAGIAGTGHGQFAEPTGIAIAGGDIYVVDSGNNRIEVLNEKAEWVTQWGSTGSEAGQFKTPLGIAVSSSGKVWVGDSLNRRLQVFSSTGSFIEAVGWGVSDGKAEAEVCTSKCEAGLKGSGNGEFASTWGLAFAGSDVYVTDTGNNRVEELSEEGKYVAQFGSKGSGNGQLEAPIGIAVNPTNGYLDVVDTGNNRVEEMTTAGAYVAQFASSGSGSDQLDFPEGIAINSQGRVYVVDDLDHRVQEWAPTITGNEGAHTTQTIYYTAGTNAKLAACGNHPEWAGLPCQAQPAAQPESGGLPNLPVTSYTYNVWDEPLTTIDTVGATTRTTTFKYDADGRVETSAIASNSSADVSLPTVTDEYSSATGALVKQSTTVEGHTKTLTSTENTVGQLTSYTDADGGVTKYEYENEKDYRLTKITGAEHTAAESSDTYGYNTTTGELASVKDSAAGTFSVIRDIEGNVTTETYPNGMNANYTRNQAGEPIALEYVKTSHCTSNCTWYTDTVSPSVHGQWLSQASTFSKESYAYSELGQLTENQETPTGKTCTARLYAFDEDGNRTSLTTRESSSEKCATTGGATQTYAYDTADRLEEPGVGYDPFGNTTSLPAADAGGSALTSAFYVDDALASQEQAGVKISYNLDPAGRVRETVSGTKKTVNHYAGPGEGVAWTCEGSEPSGKCEGSEKWTREIQGFSGLVAVQTKGEAPVLELSDLHGDMIGIASISETESKLVPANETTEYGVPRTTISAKYSWLGADEVPTELPTGIIDMGARAYVPQLGRFEQTDPQPGGSTNAYSYTDDDPVNQADPSGENTITYHYGAVESGEAEAGLPEQYGAPGAIEPPPPNRQAEVEFAAHPPWDAAAAFNEGEGAPSAAEMAEIFGCTGDHACASFSFGAVVHWVSSNAHKLVAAGIGFVSSVVIGAVTLVAVTACTDTAVMTADPFVGYDCYKIGSIGFSVALAGMAASVQAWKVEKN